MMGKLEGKVAFITGASRGIGRGIAEGFADEGARLILTARSEAALTELSRTLAERGAEVLPIKVDVTDEQQVKEAFQRGLERFARIDLLVNNAGIFDGGPIDELTLDTWDRVMAVNLRGPFLCTREAFRIMKEQGGGRIINVGSISAQRVRLRSAAYSTSKHGLWGLTQVTALEGREHGITCSCIHPGNVSVETLAEFQRQAKEPAMAVADLVPAIIAMAALPKDINMLEAIVLPVEQPYIGRG
jgi:NAD(P)-dependent dehydrogenase (short-subunit alcohol dehydrogenase family)